jgi:beta-xylosidase
MGIDDNKDGKGQPVLRFSKPQANGICPITTPAESDEFDSDSLGLQWQWQANPQQTWYALIRQTGYLRLFAIKQPEQQNNLADVPNVLLQKFPAPDFTATTKIKLTANGDGKRAGLVIMGSDYAAVYIAKNNRQVYVAQAVCANALKNGKEQVAQELPLQTDVVFLRVKISSPDGRCLFGYSVDGNHFVPLGNEFTAKPGRWIGAKVGLFAVSEIYAEAGGYADFDWFRIE